MHSIILARAVFWIAAACCAVAQLAIIASAARHPRPGEEHSQYGAVPLPRRMSEVAWALLPAVALAAVFVFTWRAINQ